MSSDWRNPSRQSALRSCCLSGPLNWVRYAFFKLLQRCHIDSPILIQRVTRRSQTWVRCSTSSVRGAFKRAWNLLRAYQPLPIRMIASHPKMIARYHNGSRRLLIVTSSSRDGSSGPGLPIRRSKPHDLGRVHREEAPEQQKGRSSRAASCSFSTVLSGSSLLPSALSRRFRGGSLYRVIGGNFGVGSLRAHLAQAQALRQLGTFSRVGCGYHRVVTG
jgi:hypothetical protein